MSNLRIENTQPLSNLEKYLDNISKLNNFDIIYKIRVLAQKGVDELAKNTPKDTGKTADSWGYVIEEKNNKIIVNWYNDNVVKYVNIAIILQYGHATRNGGYVEGIDYINPSLKDIFVKMSEEMWKAVVSL